MARFNLSPNMSLVVPIPGVEIGPDWASDLNASLTILDAHTNSPGSGVQITPTGININSDLTFNNINNAIKLRSLRFFPNATTLSLGSDIGCLYESGVGGDLWYNDGAGNQIRITQSGSVTGSSGTITGLPSGTASASFSSGPGTFVFLQATNTAANLDIGTVILRYPGSYPTPSGNFIMLEAPASLATGYAFVLPNNTPLASGAFITSDTSGVLSYTYVDNSTLSITAGVLSVPESGITTSNIADKSVSQVKLGANSVVFSGTCGNFSTSSASLVQPTNLAVAIVSTGRTICVKLVPDRGGNAASILFSNSGIVCIFRDASEIARFLVNSTATTVCFAVDDTPGAGSVTYSCQMAVTGGSASINFVRVSLFET